MPEVRQKQEKSSTEFGNVNGFPDPDIRLSKPPIPNGMEFDFQRIPLGFGL
tara:strand:- start:3257 stop:3409 length:153 start_codon:yes stop_codon:yes gene_type:complete